MKLLDSQGKPVFLSGEVGSGGEATVYRLDRRPAVLAKIFINPASSDYAAKLGWMMAHPPENPSHLENHPSLAWPDELLYENGHVAGYLMPRIQNSVTMLSV